MTSQKPFVHLLKSPTGYYFFDVNRNDIVEVDKESYTLLEKGLSSDEPMELSTNTLQNCKANNFLSSHRVKHIVHPSSKILPDLLNSQIKMLTLQLTQACNFRCSYCIYSDVNNDKQRSHSSKRMSMETAKRGIDFLLEHSRDCNSVSLGFYGGEPLLEFEMIKKLIEYAEGVFEGKKIRFNITTNGSLISDEIISYLAEKDVNLLISIDGPQEIHDQNRRFAIDGKGTFDTIISNLDFVHKKYPDYAQNIGINMVIDPAHNLSCVNNLFIKYELFGNVKARKTVINNVFSTEKSYISKEFTEESRYNEFLSFLNLFGRVGKKGSPIYENRRIGQLLDHFKLLGSGGLFEIGAPSGPCTPGHSRLFLNADGKFYPCERVSETSSVMSIGSIESGLELKKIYKLLNIGALTGDKCRNCWAFSHCTVCPNHIDDGDGLSGEMKSISCITVINSTRQKLLDMIMLKEIERSYHVRIEDENYGT